MADHIYVSATRGPVARKGPRRVMARRGSTLTLGPLTVLRLWEAVHASPAEHQTTIARAIAADVHAQLADVPALAQVDALLEEVDALRAQLGRLRATVAGREA